MKNNTFRLNSEGGKKFLKDAVKLCATNKSSISFNIQKIKELKNPIAAIKAENRPSQAKKFSPDKAGGLQNNIIICKDCKVMLLTNLWSECGLTNGANGIVKYIVYEKGKKPPSLPLYVLVYFPDYTGPSFHDTEEKLVPIAPIEKKWYVEKTEYSRTMLPLKPSYAITIHKSQGQTLKNIIIDLGDTECSTGLTYTALSRTTHLNNIAFEEMPGIKRFRSIFNAKRFKLRKKEEERLSNLSISL